MGAGRRWKALLATGAVVTALVATPAAPHPAHAATAYTAYFNWFDKASPGMSNDNIHLVNPSPTAVSGTVQLGSTSLPFGLNPGAETYVTFSAGTMGGPVRVDASGPVNAAQRVAYFRTLSEVAAVATTDATADAWWPWYDLASPGMIGDNVHLLNPDPALTANVTLTLGAQTRSVSVGPGAEVYASFPAGSIGGPLHLKSDHPVLAAQRVETHTSFNELPAMPTSAGADTLVSGWYDLASPGFTADNVHIVNPGANPAHVSIYLSGTNTGTLTVPAGGETHFNFPVGNIGGPVKLSSDQPILATQRVNYYDVFQEFRFKATGEAATDVWFNWYDDASPCFIGDNLHLTNVSTNTVTGSVTLPGNPTLTYSLNAGQETILNWPRGTIGGPIHITASTGGVLVDKREVICPPPPPPPPPAPPHKIVVSLSQQHLWAYNNGNLLLETDVTTGRPELPTPPGTYHIFYKTSPYEMISPWPYGSPFWYPDAWVNWVLEFIQGGYFLHDAPWRSWFGPGSQYGDGTHGCVNIPNGPMYQLYNWAQLGDEVDVVN